MPQCIFNHYENSESEKSQNIVSLLAPSKHITARVGGNLLTLTTSSFEFLYSQVPNSELKEFSSPVFGKRAKICEVTSANICQL